MKKLSCKIPISLLLVILFFSSADSISQESKRQARKAEKEAQMSRDYKNLGALLNTRKIIFETERIQASTGVKIYNVVQVDGSNLYIRWEDPQNTSGSLSGVRDNTTPNISPTTGLFFEGIIKDWEITKNDKDYMFTVKCSIFTRRGMRAGELLLKASVTNQHTLK